MVVKTIDCNRNRLRLLLSDDLDDASRHETEQHLGKCEFCQTTLLALAGEREWWEEASRFLERDNHDPNDQQQQFGHSTLWNDLQTELDIPSTDFVLSHLPPSNNPAMLGRLGQYEILEVIGQGGMGVVLKGYDGELNRYVAVKVLSPHLAVNGAARKRFAREAQAAAAIVHPNVLAIHGVESDTNLPYLVMPLVSGETLQHRIDREGPLDLKDILRIAAQTARALSAAHAQGLVHRDVKPANILLDGSLDRVLLSDFGLARAADDATLTHSGMIAGTPHYMSPEQARGETVDQRSDLFSLGSVIFAMSTGRPPFRAETPLGIAKKVDSAKVRPIHGINEGLPEWLEAIRSSLMNASIESRAQSAADIAELLEQCLAHVQQPKVTPLPDALLRMVRRRPWLNVQVLMTGSVVCIALLFAPLLLSPDDQSVTEKSLSEEPVNTEAEEEFVNNESKTLESVTNLDLNNDIDLKFREFESDLLEFEQQFNRPFPPNQIPSPEPNTHP